MSEKISELIRKMSLFGVGVVTLTQEKIEEFTQEMIKKGEINQEEGKKFVKEVLSEKEKQLKEIENKINQKITETIKNRGIVTKEEIEILEKRIEELEKKLK